MNHKINLLITILLVLTVSPALAQSTPSSKPTTKPSQAKGLAGSRQQRLTRPNVRVTITTRKKNSYSENLNLKKGRTSFANYNLAPTKMDAVKIKVSDKIYEEFKELAFKILKNPPESTYDSKRVTLTISLLLIPGEGKELGLKKRSVVIFYQKGENKNVDLIYEKAVALLNKHRKKKETAKSKANKKSVD